MGAGIGHYPGPGGLWVEVCVGGGVSGCAEDLSVGFLISARLDAEQWPSVSQGDQEMRSAPSGGNKTISRCC